MTRFEKIRELTSTIEGMAKAIDAIDLGFDEGSKEEIEAYALYRNYMNLPACEHAMGWLKGEYIPPENQ